MSIDIDGFNEDDVSASLEAAQLAATLTHEQGFEASTAYTVGQRAGQYAAEVIFASLRFIGVIPPEGFNYEDFERAARTIVDKSIHPR